MNEQQTLDTIEKSLDQVEETLDAIVPEVVETVNTVKNNPLLLVGAGLIGLSVGLVIGYKYAERKLTFKFEEMLTAEVEDTKRYYAALNKKDDFETPESALKLLHPDAAERVEDEIERKRLVTPETAAAAVTKYQGGSPATKVENVFDKEVDIDDETATVTIETTAVTETVLVDGVPLERDSIDEEMAARDRLSPYVITKDEFFENITDAGSNHLTYYEKDQVLIDNDDEYNPILETDHAVGDDNLVKFGHRSEDRDTVYVRNEQTAQVFEIVRSKGSYSKEVLGLDDDEDEIDKASSYTGGGRRFRDSDD